MKNRKEINYEEMIRTLAKDPRVRRMAAYPQHGGVSTLEHAESVTRMSFRINAALHLNANPKTLLYGGMLHDYYLYDWHHHAGHLHGLTHPEAALERAEKDFDLPEGANSQSRGPSRSTSSATTCFPGPSSAPTPWKDGSSAWRTRFPQCGKPWESEAVHDSVPVFRRIHFL